MMMLVNICDKNKLNNKTCNEEDEGSKQSKLGLNLNVFLLSPLSMLLMIASLQHNADPGMTGRVYNGVLVILCGSSSRSDSKSHLGHILAVPD